MFLNVSENTQSVNRHEYFFTFEATQMLFFFFLPEFFFLLFFVSINFEFSERTDSESNFRISAEKPEDWNFSRAGRSENVEK